MKNHQEKYPKKMEIYNFPDKEFKEIFVMTSPNSRVE